MNYGKPDKIFLYIMTVFYIWDEPIRKGFAIALTSSLLSWTLSMIQKKYTQRRIQQQNVTVHK